MAVFGPGSGADTRVMSSETVGSETVRPRGGKYFLRSALYYGKNYRNVNDGVLDKPRSMFYLAESTFSFDYDTEGYLGMSIYTPKNYEHETGTRDESGYVTLLSVNADTNRSFFVVSQYVQAPANQAHWWLKVYTSATSTNEANASTNTVDLGPVVSDLGEWTDFVFRFRANPFSTATNPASKGIAGAKNQTYPGNKGILQVWKAEGAPDANGNRKLQLKFSKVDVPVGLVPQASTKIQIEPRVYKGGWKKHPTDVRGPVWFGFDEMRFGLVGRDGTGFSDVAPSGSTTLAGPTPSPPTNLVVN